jgi:DNA-binding transcriptional LysR family regulator
LNYVQLRDLDLNLLFVLDALLRETSVTRAGQRLGLTTSAVSHALGRLRAALGDPLLVRAGRSMILTPRAEALKADTRAVLAAATALFAPQSRFDPATLQRTFRVHATDHIVSVLGPALDRRIAREAPGVNLQFVANPPDEASPLREGQIDLGIGAYDELPPELYIQRLFSDRFVCVVRKNHPNVRRTLSLDRYVSLGHVLVAPRGRPGGAIDDLLAERGLSRRVIRAVPHFIAALLLVAESDYVVTISARLAGALAPKLGLEIVALPLSSEPYTLSQIWHPRSDADPAHRWLRGALLATAKCLPRMR